MSTAERVKKHLDQSPLEVMWRLPGVGWLSVKTMTPYPKGAPKRKIFFTGGPLKEELNGRPPGDLRAMEKEAFPYDPPERFADLPFPVEDLTAAIRDAILAGRAIDLPPLGTFAVLEKPARPGWNPDTDEPIEVPARKLVQFRPA